MQDAFERQLLVHNIHQKGQHVITVEKFLDSSCGILFPEFIYREINRGYSIIQNPAELIASTIYDKSSSHYLIYENTNNDLMYGNITYNAIKNQPLTEFSVFLKWVGVQFAYDDIDKIYTAIISEEENLQVETMTHISLFRNNVDNKTHFLGNNRIKDIVASSRSQHDIKAILVKVPMIKNDTIIGIDNRFAIRERISCPLSISVENIMNRNFNCIHCPKQNKYSIMINDVITIYR